MPEGESSEQLVRAHVCDARQEALRHSQSHLPIFTKVNPRHLYTFLVFFLFVYKKEEDEDEDGSAKLVSYPFGEGEGSGCVVASLVTLLRLPFIGGVGSGG